MGETLNTQEKNGYGSRFGLLCLMVGGSVGTGNLWRYPRLACQYGGGFILATVIALIGVAIPLVMVENFAGRASRHSSAGAFRDILGEKYTWMGTFATTCYFMMHSCYAVVLAWCVRYMFMSLGKTYFGVKDKMALFNQVAATDWGTTFCWIGVMVLAYICLRRQRLVEKANETIVPILAVILIILVIYALTRDGASEGLKYAFSIDPKLFFSGAMWLDAFAQVFWSLGPGCMLVISIAKFNARNEDVAVNCKVQGFGDMSFALLGTLVVLPSIFSFEGADKAMELCKSGNNGLTFLGLTSMFEAMPAGAILGALFFLALSLAAFSSVIAATTSFMGILTDTGMGRKKAAAIAVGAQMVVGLPSILSQDIMTNQDTVWGYGIFIGAMFSSFLGFKFGAKRIRTDFINPVSNRKVGKAFDISIGGLALIVTTAILIIYIIQSFGPGWWNPISTSSLGTMFLQWAVIFCIAFGTRSYMNRNIKGRYFNGKEFPEIPEELMKEI